MGNYEDMEVDLNCIEMVKLGEIVLKISYKFIDGWYGFGFVDFVNDWGDILGGYDLSGVILFSFWAKGS